MDLDTYKSLAIRTEAPVDEGVKVRFIECVPLFRRTIGGWTPQGRANNLKRYIYYGKELPENLRHELSQVPANDQEVNLRWCGAAGSEVSPGRLEMVIRISHAILGWYSEIDEITDAVFMAILPKGQSLQTNLFEEGGDMLWYWALFVSAFGGSANDIGLFNIDKLRVRFPDRFTQEDALVRNLDGENRVLYAGSTRDELVARSIEDAGRDAESLLDE